MFARRLSANILFCQAVILSFKSGISDVDKRKPIYNIGHMVNSIEEVIPFIEKGANVLECDVQFFPNGSVKEAYHGCPGDCSRDCDKRVQFQEYLEYIRNITDPSIENSYYDKLIIQYFDVKLYDSEDFRYSGRDLARHILDYLWTDGVREREIKVILYVNNVDKKDAISGFLQEFKDRNKEHLLENVGYDGFSHITYLEALFQELNVSNIWLGDGTMNCYIESHPVDRLKEEIKIRDSGGFIKKVYGWTIDLEPTMKNYLRLGVDGIFTNRPELLVKVLNEPEYKKSFRPATVFDSPFARFK